MKTVITFKSFKSYEGEKLKSTKSTTGCFLFYIFETIKTRDAKWTTYAIPLPINETHHIYLITGVGERSKKLEKIIKVNGELEHGKRAVMEITVGDKSEKFITLLAPSDIIEIFDNANDFVEWCNNHGEVFLCEKKRDVYKSLKRLSEQNKWTLKAKLISYHQLWWNR